ncbi:CRISPR-associated endoribonuclease Cas6 [Fervidobacterium thailandense]|uniref:Uncharacterized protein n=1 Tax=Fervidobacterium thailandense TaxID=1008305 RepID=A0A1E3G0L2_9BACT|nr:CRISPR-associated endoribonuclease Cas6 [Fervidobacterium thailandense]ODN29680.1 hypothetical protein A4H02_09480 [Fervidobacterium thailandense]
MLYSVVLTLQAINSGQITSFAGQKIHGWLFSLLKKADADLAPALHASVPNKAFTVSSFLGQKLNYPLEIKEGELYKIRLTFLNDYVFQAVSGEIYELLARAIPIQLEKMQFVINKLTLDPEDPWSGFITEEELLENTEENKEISLKFYTPTCFRIGDLHLREPEPEKVFTSLLYKWNTHCSTKFDENLKDKFKEIVILESDVIQKRVQFSHFYIQGFVGTVKYQLPEIPSLIKTANVLAKFAFYSGVGYKTTMGLGQVKRT